MRVGISSLNNLLEVSRVVQVPDGMGGYQDQYQKIGDVWAGVEIVRVEHRGDKSSKKVQQPVIKMITRDDIELGLDCAVSYDGQMYRVFDIRKGVRPGEMMSIFARLAP